MKRPWLIALAAILFVWLAPRATLAQPTPVTDEPVRIGLTPVFLDDLTASLERWRSYLERRLQRPVVFTQRASYRGIIDLLLDEKLDFAWICGYPYTRYASHLQLLAVPVYQGKPLYHSYLIVPISDAQTRSLSELRGKVFAYADPDSNSGYLVTQYRLLQMRAEPQHFFRKAFFTWAHRKVVEAVAAGLADAGAVDGYVWDTLAKLHPELTAQTRIIEKSPAYGFPPFVARTGVPHGTFAAVQSVLLDMQSDAEGRLLLERLNLDGFIAGEPALFDEIAQMKTHVMDKTRAAQP